jgi:hypothetical protein
MIGSCRIVVILTEALDLDLAVHDDVSLTLIFFAPPCRMGSQ